MAEYYEDNIKKIICDYKENYKQIMESINEYKECANERKRTLNYDQIGEGWHKNNKRTDSGN